MAGGTTSHTRRDSRQKLYATRAWRDLSRIYRSEHPMCERCGEHYTEAVHHKLSPFDHGLSKNEAMVRLTDPENLTALCRTCHMEVHREIEEEKQRRKREQGRIFYIRY